MEGIVGAERTGIRRELSAEECPLSGGVARQVDRGRRLRVTGIQGVTTNCGTGVGEASQRGVLQVLAQAGHKKTRQRDAEGGARSGRSRGGGGLGGGGVLCAERGGTARQDEDDGEGSHTLTSMVAPRL